MEGVSADGTYLTPGQVARRLGVSPKTVYRWATSMGVTSGEDPDEGG